MLIVGYAHRIRSERRLCEEVRLNLAYRWFCKLDLTDPIPDHSTFSKNRHALPPSRTSTMCCRAADVEASRSVRTGETHATCKMIERVQDRFGLWPERLIADTAYGLGEVLDWLVEGCGIEPHIPMIDMSKRTNGTFKQEDFAYDHEADAYICPAGKELRHGWRTYRGERKGPKDTTSAKYSALKADCEAYPLKEKCCLKGVPRKVTRSEFEGARQMARDIAKTDEYAISCKLRKKVEMLFAHLKRILGLGRLRLRGSCGANDEFVLAATAQNLRKLAKLIPMPQKPQPA